MYNTEKFDNFEPKRFTSDGVINIKGTDIPYHTVSEDNVFYDNEGKAIASIFSCGSEFKYSASFNSFSVIYSP